MNLKELKLKNIPELHKMLAEQRDNLRDLRFKDASKQLKKVTDIRVVRTTISRILTLLNTKKEENIK
ncbi:50S ribosomal protein L29 [Candidatus Parcubacteria bacterium]|nr:50S ribosomal protein L29 [Patescibacteria group bacterium]MBU4309504.1 50S ribosomal protein L29 [Patescibacteria group bacterium]MBU4432064.1 50S ribosomal protein L29 [Patescibacteria group bacterium]MBU4577210.1 50S ribosomal protein L29 [Patescibacteria group bacterium]MCG2696856.1 50S ribosomal protein L29 [Candidatus Parcubacteria bacterium]